MISINRLGMCIIIISSSLFINHLHLSIMIVIGLYMTRSMDNPAVINNRLSLTSGTIIMRKSL